jgi:hypothetical protein
MRSREISLTELERLQATLTQTLLRLRVHDPLPLLVGLLMNVGSYVATHIHRLRDWGSRPDIDDLDLIGYSTRCIFEADLMLEYYGRRGPEAMIALIKGEIDRDDFDILTSVVAFLRAPTAETESIFADHARRMESKHPRTPPFHNLAAETGAADEYKSFYKLYSKYAHPSAYLLMADRREVWAGHVRDLFLDRAVRYAGHCSEVMEIFLRNVIEPQK